MATRMHLAELSRATLRKQQLQEMENEQRIEDAEALKLTEEQRTSLLHSFSSVKFEWSDLDGMRNVRRRYNSPPNPITQASTPSATTHRDDSGSKNAFAVLTNTHLDGEATIRGMPHGASPKLNGGRFIKPARFSSGTTLKANLLGKKMRSPVRGLFPSGPGSPSLGSILFSTHAPSSAPAPTSTPHTNLTASLSLSNSSSNSDPVPRFKIDAEGWWDEEDSVPTLVPTLVTQNGRFEDPSEVCYGGEPGTGYEPPTRAASPTPYSSAPVYTGGAPLAPSSGSGLGGKRKR
ncbi:hypothetical protein C8R43DRAFT_1232547 [Mycena crocata]|nr:hypothetical protein C8R43DRAFT_1232547 [Mycena crocata]